MYSPYNSSTRDNFLNQELSLKFYNFPQEVEDAYSSTYSWLSNIEGMNDFDKKGSPSSLDPLGEVEKDRRNTGREFTFFLPSHTLKAYHLLLLIESELLNDNRTVVIDKNRISIVDIGCGGGSATIALISLLTNYQRYKINNDLPISKISLNCFGIDPNEFALQIYCKFVEECATRVNSFLIDVSIDEIIPTSFQEGLNRIIEWAAEENNKHCVVMAFGNVIRPFTKSLNSYKHRLGLMGFFEKFLPDSWGREYEEANQINTFLDVTNVDQIVIPILGSDTRDLNGQRKRWKDEIVDFQKALRSQLKKSHRIQSRDATRQIISIFGPSDCYFRKHRSVNNPKEINFDCGYTVIQNHDVINDNDWNSILDYDNLLLAWARVRNELSFGNMEDTIELKLFEVTIDEKIEKLRNEILTYDWNVLHIEDMLNFRSPKGVGKEPRPMSLGRLEDQILATAILQVKGRNYLKQSARSYAYRFSNQDGEFLYKNWFSLYEKYIEDARKIAKQNPDFKIIRTDLTSYYTTIKQMDLLSSLKHHTHFYESRGQRLLQELILRDCGISTQDLGIPQGHIWSGILGNHYLNSVDNLFNSDNEWGIEFHRYVDDMIFIFPPEIKGGFVLELLDQELKKLGLIRSENKTSKVMSSQDFLEITSSDELLDELDKTHTHLLDMLYKLDREHTRILSKNWWKFVDNYQCLLTRVDVYLGIPRLSRKLRKNMNWWKRLTWIKKLNFPPIQTIDDLNDIDSWSSEFKKGNSSWMKMHHDHLNTLLSLFEDNLEVLNSTDEIPPFDYDKARRRLKFSINRLAQLGFGRVVNLVGDLLILQPWLLNIRRVCEALALQGEEDILVDRFERLRQFNDDQWAYIRAMILKSFSALPIISNETLSTIT
jgi:hypothetical protein